MINLGSLMDIPTGTPVKGVRGETIINGGLGNLTGVVGIGNNFKSTVLHHMLLTAMGRMKDSFGNTYDTEINIHETHLQKLADRIEELGGEMVFDTGRWVITSKKEHSADEWYDILRDFLVQKPKEKKMMVTTPFKSRDKVNALQILLPTFTEVDSLSEFVTRNVMETQANNSLGDSGANMVYMQQGQQKNRFLMEIPALAGAAYNYTLMTAHIGSEFNMDPRNPAPKKLQHLKGGVKLKGVPEKFTFLMNNCWHCYNAAPLINQTTKAPEYPRDSDDDLKGDTDLNEVIVRQLRSKSGPSGMAVTLIVSQTEGVLPTLSEFHHCKTSERYGFEGNDKNYNMALRPEVKLARHTVRGKIDSDALLRRAIEVTADMCQMDQLWHHLDEGFLCTPKELYDDLIAKGYDWDILLNSRRWWCLTDDEPNQLPFLSTMDLLYMRQGTYHPYWLASDKRTVLPGNRVGDAAAEATIAIGKAAKTSKVVVAPVKEASYVEVIEA
jgi:hypothetical protein